VAVQQIKVNDGYIYFDDTEVNPRETGIAIKEESLDDTIVVNPINEEDLLSETKLDVFGDEDE